MDFEEKNRELALAVFSNGELTHLSTDQSKMLGYFFSSGTYGTTEHVVKNGVENSGKVRYFFKRAFLPMVAVRENYPVFYQHKILLPFLPLYRLMTRWENAKAEVKALRKI